MADVEFLQGSELMCRWQALISSMVVEPTSRIRSAFWYELREKFMMISTPYHHVFCSWYYKVSRWFTMAHDGHNSSLDLIPKTSESGMFKNCVSLTPFLLQLMTKFVEIIRQSFTTVSIWARYIRNSSKVEWSHTENITLQQQNVVHFTDNHIVNFWSSWHKHLLLIKFTLSSKCQIVYFLFFILS